MTGHSSQCSQHPMQPPNDIPSMPPAPVTDIPVQLELHEDIPSEVLSIPSIMPDPAVIPTTQIHEILHQPMV